MSTHSAIQFNSAWAGLSQIVARLTRAWQRRRLVGRLGELDDRLLADIGITRQDVASALAESIFVDPSEKLAARAHEAKLARRATARDIRAAEGAGRRRAA